MRAFTVAAALAVGLTMSAGLLADDEAAARQAFTEGKELFEAGDYAAAADAFRRANGLKPNWKLLYNIGQSEAAAKRHGLALQTFEAYLSQGGDDIPEDRYETVLQEVERLRRVVGFLKIKAPDGALVEVDGVVRGETPLHMELPVAASVRHEVSVRLADSRLPSQTIQVVGGKTAELVFEPDPDDGPPAPAPAQEPEGGAAEPGPEPDGEATSGLWIAGWTGVSLGAALLVGGAITGGMAMSKNGELEDSCDDGVCASGVDPGLQDQRDSLALATDILLPVGGVIAATGAVLLIVDAADGEDGDDGVAALRPVLAPDRAGLVIEGRF